MILELLCIIQFNLRQMTELVNILPVIISQLKYFSYQIVHRRTCLLLGLFRPEYLLYKYPYIYESVFLRGQDNNLPEKKVFAREPRRSIDIYFRRRRNLDSKVNVSVLRIYIHVGVYISRQFPYEKKGEAELPHFCRRTTFFACPMGTSSPIFIENSERMRRHPLCNNKICGFKRFFPRIGF